MRGKIESYSRDTGRGTIRAADGRVFAFDRARLLRRSKSPWVGGAIVFRLKGGEVARAIVPTENTEPSRWETTIAVLDMVFTALSW
ncbi:MAG: hypothetical protein EKK41_11685 [Hyphomicrobiales bacterium]|nr:MAG: hypothetical protein EKK41_11685 [Hyphomicrobiales bacterium]